MANCGRLIFPSKSHLLEFVGRRAVEQSKRRNELARVTAETVRVL